MPESTRSGGQGKLLIKNNQYRDSFNNDDVLAAINEVDNEKKQVSDDIDSLIDKYINTPDLSR